jgi:hypothetical protein
VQPDVCTRVFQDHLHGEGIVSLKGDNDLIGRGYVQKFACLYDFCGQIAIGGSENELVAGKGV